MSKLYEFPQNIKDFPRYSQAGSSLACYHDTTGEAIAFKADYNNELLIVYNCHSSSNNTTSYRAASFFVFQDQLVLANFTTATFNGVNVVTYQPIEEFDLAYKPELEVYFNVISVFIVIAILWTAYRMLLRPFWRRIR